MAQLLQTTYQSSGRTALLEPIKVISPQLATVRPLLEYKVDDRQQRVTHRQQRPLPATPAGQPPVLSRQVRPLGVAGCPERTSKQEHSALRALPVGRQHLRVRGDVRATLCVGLQSTKDGRPPSRGTPAMILPRRE